MSGSSNGSLASSITCLLSASAQASQVAQLVLPEPARGVRDAINLVIAYVDEGVGVGLLPAVGVADAVDPGLGVGDVPV